MKVLLTAINAKYIHSNLALFSLQSYAKEYQEEIELLECTINHRVDYILQEIYKKKPDVLCFSCYIWNIAFVKEIAMEFNKLCPDVPIWAGGPEVSYETETFLLENPCFRGVMIGEGEKTFRDLCHFYKNNEKIAEQNNIYSAIPSKFPKDFNPKNKQTKITTGNLPTSLLDIKGLCIRTQDEIKLTGNQLPLNMDEIPFAYKDLKEFENRIIYYESSRGCPFRCSYCLSSVEKTLRFRSLHLVTNELQFFLDNKVKQVKFVDRTFNCDHTHAMGIWKYIKEHDNGCTNFHFEIAADLLTEDEIEFLKTLRQGLIQLEIGVQSTNEPTIQEIHRTMNLEELKQIVLKIKEKGNIHQHLDLIAGLPYEGEEAFQISFDEIYALKPEQLQLGFLKVLKGSYMYEQAKTYELLYHSQPPYEVLSTKWLSYDKVLKIKQVEEMLEVYYNSMQFPKTIRFLETLFHSAYEMFDALGKYYESKQYFSMKHTRIRRLEIVLEFVETIAKDRYEEAREMAIFDLYSRENAKSRPSFAPDEKQWKDMTYEYCKNGKMQHLEKFTYQINESETWSGASQKRNPYFIRFDYENKNELTGQVAYQIMERE